ncbi:MAG: response regulator [Bacteroidales bacterium]|nr:response regulator [Bacteroidales bacterium]HOK98378.1 response regulator [Bacteroidales bacterium]HPO65330.1 response regulator [Bacteroidales bacterium]
MAHPKIMLIDDSSTNNLLYASILSDEGYEVVVCEEAKSALKSIQKEKPDLIILDLMMPGMDGFDLLTTMKTHSELANIPVIMLTANASEESEKRARSMGVKAFLSKPAGIKEITDAVKEVLCYS